MNCKTCGYRLWNLASRQCPECGSGFAPSQFDFAPNEVQFVCPGCEQTYYGTSPIGHLVPPEFDCVTCGRHLTMDAMVLRPADWSREDRTGAASNPWLERKQRGRVKSFLATVGWGMARPVELLRATPVDSPMNDAWLFVLASFALYSLGGYLPIAAFVALVGVGFSGASVTGSAVSLFVPLASVAVGMVAWALFTVIWALLAHVVVLGGGPRSTIRRTFQAMCYTCGPMCVVAVPCLGLYLLPPLGVIWWMVCGILALKEAQQVGTGRAIAAVSVWPGVLAVGLVGLTVWAGVSSTQSYAAMQAQMSSGVNAPTLGYAVLNHAGNDPNGRGPAHAIDITASQTWITADFFVDHQTHTTGSDAPLPGTGADLDQFEQAPPQQQQTWRQQAAAAQPADVVAHRLGDYVFTYHGIDFRHNPDPGLWIVVYSPEPSVNPPLQPGEYFQVARADGSTDTLDAGLLSVELAKQNTLRAALGLPPLPAPATVTHAQPATSP